MSAVAALKGYRTQFLYSLHYILSNSSQPYSYRLEGEEDLDVLDALGNILYAIQVKNLSRTLTLSDLLAHKKTSFLKRFVDTYPGSNPVLASFGPVQQELKDWQAKPNHQDNRERTLFVKAGIAETRIAFIKGNVLFLEINEEAITAEILEMLKAYKSIDPIPTAENLLYYIQYTAEKQQLISARDLLETIDRIGNYLSERIAYTNQYGIFIRPLIKAVLSEAESEKLRSEFYHGISARYAHIYMGLDVQRSQFLESISEGFDRHNILLISGASGQGKSTLAYRYVFNKASASLIYELSLQQDPVKTNEAINAIAGLTKGLNVPVYFILHVTPNTTSWLKIAREFASHPFLRLLVSIRNEDLFRAQSSEIDFLYTDVALELAEEEAEVIFKGLEQRQVVKTYHDFKDAWVSFSTGVPLLEFIHGITQGSSLRDKLKSQVAQLSLSEAENPIGQMDLLRTLCLADAVGTRIDAAQIKDIPNIKLIIDKFEKEYLLKHSTDGKYLSGLHPIRSMLLADLLFDEFVACRKDYMEICLRVIVQEDLYSFMLQAFYQRILSPAELIAALKISGRNSWTIYGAAAKSLLWSGIRTYLDHNLSLIGQVQDKCGDAWTIVTDVYHGNVVDLDAILSSICGDNPALVDYLRDIQKKLSPKSAVYEPIIQLFELFPFPEVPNNFSQWKHFAETLFWLAQTSNNAPALDKFEEADFREAFGLLDLQSLALLMLGMHYYSPEFDQIRLRLASVFDDRVRNEFLIPLLEVEQEISFDFVIDITREDKTAGWHELTIRIIELLRTAYPEKAAFKSQGHGHRLEMLPTVHDETVKHIPAGSLPLPTWVSINANIIALVNYAARPEDWFDFHQQLRAWEIKIKEMLEAFSRSFLTFKKLNDFAVLAPVADQAKYESLTRLTAPKNTVDPLGISIIGKSDAPKPEENNKQDKVAYFANKYEAFLKSYNDYKTAIEIFVRQSGEACFDGAKSVVVSDHMLDERLLHLSFVNLNDAVAKRAVFQAQRDMYFSKFSSDDSGLDDAVLFQTATTWKSFWAAIRHSDLKRITVTESITGLKNDFSQALTRAIKAANKSANYKISYRNDAETGNLPVFKVQVSDPLHNILALKETYQLIFRCVAGTEHAGLKHLMLQRYFSSIYIISELRGYLLDLKWHEFPLHLFMETPFDELNAYRFAPRDIDPQIVLRMKLKSWLLLHPDVKLIVDVAAGFERLRLAIGHLADLKFFNENDRLDEMGTAMIQRYVVDKGKDATEIWNDLLERLAVLAGEFPEEVAAIESEEEQEYWLCMLEVMNGLMPKGEELDRAFLDMESLRIWTEKLALLNERWSLFVVLLQRKVLFSYQIQT